VHLLKNDWTDLNYNKVSKMYLDCDAPECESTISVDLYAHQKKSLLRMKEMESQDSINVEVKLNGNHRIQNKVTSSLGILSDKVGSGKTFTMLALMAEKEHIIKKKSIPSISSHLVSISTLHNESNVHPKTNLIIIPHSLVKQWKDSTIMAFKDTNITYKFMTTKKECDNTEEIFDYDVIIITIRQIDRLGYPRDLHFRRIVIDEPHDLSVPMSFIKPVKFEHMWFVCATPRSLLQNNRVWIRLFDIHKNVHLALNQEDDISISDLIAIRNRPEVINASLNLPEYTQTRIECLEPSWLRVLSGNIASNALERLHAHDIRGALEVLQCPCKEGEDILTALTREYAKNVEIAEIEVKKYTEMPAHLISEQTRKNKIDHYQKKAIEFKEKIQHIKTRIDQRSDCPICLYDISDPRAITPCCQNSFCLECILESTRNHPRCPLCKNNMNIKDIIVDHNNTPVNPTTPTESRKKSKIDTLMSILKNRTPDQKFLVVSKYASVFYDITHRLQVDNQCDLSVLSGTGTTINKSIENFKNGNKPIILLNTQYFGSGLNLEMATDIIVYHRLSDVDLKQAIGRAQRIGRTRPLRVTYLTHESEY
jgi:SNF2 family DNA or RNA helicase